MKKTSILLLLIFCILLPSYLILVHTKVMTETGDYREKIAASQLAADCFAEIKALKQALGIPMDPASDVNATGMIGQDYSGITTTLGNLEAKRTSTNPNMAAVMVDMFHELGLKSGDRVAVNYSGSFPALNIATLCAIEVMDLDPVIISSFGASTHGANDPELTFLDMEHHLIEAGLISHRSTYFSIGGMEDVGKEMAPELKDSIVQRLEGYGYQLIYNDDLIDNIHMRYGLYQSYSEIQCFINVGGNDASFGDSSLMVYIDGGIITTLPDRDSSTGLVQLFLRDHIPVIHLLNIKSLATKYGLPIDPKPAPAIGEGGVYYQYAYHKGVSIAVLAVVAVLLYLVYRQKTPKSGASVAISRKPMSGAS